MGKRTFTAEYKTQVVLEVLREEKQLGEIAAEHGISPNQLRNWKREFVENAARVFNESKREKDIRAKEKELEAERAELLSTIGQLTMELAQKKSIEVFGPDYEKKFNKRPL